MTTNNVYQTKQKWKRRIAITCILVGDFGAFLLRLGTKAPLQTRERERERERESSLQETEGKVYIMTLTKIGN